MVDTFTKGSGTKVSTAAAKEAEDPDYQPDDEDDKKPPSKRTRQADGEGHDDSQKASQPKKTQKGACGRRPQSTSSARAPGEDKPHGAEGSGPASSSADAKAGDTPTKAANPTASRKQPKTREPSPEPREESEDEDEEARARAAAGKGGEAEMAGGRKGDGRRKYSRRFQRDLPSMLYGFGDVRTPLPQTVQVTEDLVVDYVTQILRKASAAAEERVRSTRGGSSRIKECDLLFVLRKDRKRLSRVLELLEAFEEQKQARGKEQPDELAKTFDK